ncbi:hypothetical protein BDV59DRAFT_98336 [Aspergillus ambiguus]|uniref:uncharacterized protein n=1 Tax=Aspergillus ambiguus TaxID=176160 RepID=UPI003CCD37AC
MDSLGALPPPHPYAHVCLSFSFPQTTNKKNLHSLREDGLLPHSPIPSCSFSLHMPINPLRALQPSKTSANRRFETLQRVTTYLPKRIPPTLDKSLVFCGREKAISSSFLLRAVNRLPGENTTQPNGFNLRGKRKAPLTNFCVPHSVFVSFYFPLIFAPRGDRDWHEGDRQARGDLSHHFPSGIIIQP